MKLFQLGPRSCRTPSKIWRSLGNSQT
jgi:hypothetical protein